MEDADMNSRPRLHERDGTFYFRAKVPADLLPFYPGREVKFSLKTRDRQKAWNLTQIESIRLDQEFAMHRAKLHGRPAELTILTRIDDAFIAGICTTFLRDSLESDITLRTSDFGDVEQAVRKESQAEHAQMLRKALATGRTEVVDSLLRVFLYHSGYELRVPPADYKRLAYAFLQAYVKGNQNIILRDEGEIVETEALAPAAKLLAAPILPAAQPMVTWSQVFDQWKKAAKRRPKTADEFERILKSLERFAQSKTPDTLVKKDLIEFRDHLLISQQSKTVEKKISIVRTLFRLAVRDDLLAADPTDGVIVSMPKTSKKTRVGFTLDELDIIFASDLFLMRNSVRQEHGAAVYWMPMISLYSGARIEEIAQLRVAEIKQAPGYGPYFDITDEGEDSELKNDASRRRVPIHSALIEAGLLDYAKSLKDQNGYLFPDLRPDKYQGRSSAFSKTFNRNLRAPLGITDKRKVFHSFRHTFKHLARELGMPEDVHDVLTGHVSSSEGRRYGNDEYPLAPLFNAIKSFQVPGLKPIPGFDPAIVPIPRQRKRVRAT